MLAFRGKCVRFCPPNPNAEANMPKVAQRFLEVDPWAVVEKGFHPNRSRASESVF